MGPGALRWADVTIRPAICRPLFIAIRKMILPKKGRVTRYLIRGIRNDTTSAEVLNKLVSRLSGRRAGATKVLLKTDWRICLHGRTCRNRDTRRQDVLGEWRRKWESLPPCRECAKTRRKQGFLKSPAEFCDHPCVPPDPLKRSSTSGDVGAVRGHSRPTIFAMHNCPAPAVDLAPHRRHLGRQPERPWAARARP